MDPVLQVMHKNNGKTMQDNLNENSHTLLPLLAW